MKTKPTIMRSIMRFFGMIFYSFNFMLLAYYVSTTFMSVRIFSAMLLLVVLSPVIVFLAYKVTPRIKKASALVRYGLLALYIGLLFFVMREVVIASLALLVVGALLECVRKPVGWVACEPDDINSFEYHLNNPYCVASPFYNTALSPSHDTSCTEIHGAEMTGSMFSDDGSVA